MALILSRITDHDAIPSVKKSLTSVWSSLQEIDLAKKDFRKDSSVTATYFSEERSWVVLRKEVILLIAGTVTIITTMIIKSSRLSKYY